MKREVPASICGTIPIFYFNGRTSMRFSQADRLTKNLRRSVLPGTYCVVQRISRFGNRFSHKNTGKNLDDNEEMTIFGITIEHLSVVNCLSFRKSQLLPQWRINGQDRNARSWLVRHNLGTVRSNRSRTAHIFWHNESKDVPLWIDPNVKAKGWFTV